VTIGSFYRHFKSREVFLQAFYGWWEAEHAFHLVDQARSEPLAGAQPPPCPDQSVLEALLGGAITPSPDPGVGRGVEHVGSACLVRRGGVAEGRRAGLAGGRGAGASSWAAACAWDSGPHSGPNLGPQKFRRNPLPGAHVPDPPLHPHLAASVDADCPPGTVRSTAATTPARPAERPFPRWSGCTDYAVSATAPTAVGSDTRDQGSVEGACLGRGHRRTGLSGPISAPSQRCSVRPRTSGGRARSRVVPSAVPGAVQGLVPSGFKKLAHEWTGPESGPRFGPRFGPESGAQPGGVEEHARDAVVPIVPGERPTLARCSDKRLRSPMSRPVESPLASGERLFSPEEVASYLGVPVKTLFQWRYKGVGPRGIRVGRHVRYRSDDVEAWLERVGDPERRGEVA